MKRFAFIIMMALLLSGIAAAQTKTYAIEDIDSLMLTQQKPILILLTTDWCKYCQMQKQQIARNKQFQNSADKFYYVTFNAERKDAIVFHQQPFSYKATTLSSGIHQLAMALNGAEGIAFPTWVLLDAQYRVLFRHSGVLKPAEVNALLKTMDN